MFIFMFQDFLESKSLRTLQKCDSISITLYGYAKNQTKLTLYVPFVSRYGREMYADFTPAPKRRDVLSLKTFSFK